MGGEVLAAGVGLRPPHISSVLASPPGVGFFEVHTENYFGGGAKLKRLDAVALRHRLSLHGVGLSLGAADGLDAAHLEQIAALCDRYQPLAVSEHLSFSAVGGVHAPDLLPSPLTLESMEVFAANIDQAQTRLKRPILVENPSAYLAFPGDEFDEPTFLAELCARTGCGLLLDLNNIHVSAANLGFDPFDYLHRLPAATPIGEYHLAGHAERDWVLIDTHGAAVCDGVWRLFEAALARFGDAPTLIEWDTDLPELSVLLNEAARADGRRRPGPTDA